VGKTVPVFRDEENGWEMGEVQEVDGDKHAVVFADGVEGKVCISLSPFADYLKHHSKEPPATDSQKFNEWLLRDIFARSLGEKTDQNLPPLSPLVKKRRVDYMHSKYEPHPANWTLDRVAISSKFSPLRAPSPFFADDLKPIAAITPPRRPVGTSARGTPKRKRQDTPRKTLTKAWNTKEDTQLMQLVKTGSQPTKWSDISQSMGERTGKQCRERYLNHLTPKLRVEEWTTQEDAQLCKLYQSMGSKWALMAKILKGRTDNNIKNRFHHIRRRLEKDVARIVKTRKIDEVASLIQVDAIRRSPLRSETNSEFAIRARQILPYLAADSVKDNIDRVQFGPFVPAKGELCQRCNFIVPSIQTGRLISKKIGWCESCTKIPPYVVGDMLRQCLHLRRDKC